MCIASRSCHVSCARDWGRKRLTFMTTRASTRRLRRRNELLGRAFGMRAVTREAVTTMTPDCDLPGASSIEDAGDESLTKLAAERAEAEQASLLDDGSSDQVESPELPGADLSDLAPDELRVPVVPQQADEFVCVGCFLIQPRHRLAVRRAGKDLCRECA